MDSEWSNLFSVDEILGGLPARRASGLLYAIEGRTAWLVARAKRAMAPDISGRSAEQVEQAFLTALSSGATLPIEPAIQHLERYARDWASLVPDDPSIRASLARMIGQKYRLARSQTPRIQRTLGTGTAEVQTRFQELHAEPIDSIFVASLSAVERLKWLRSRIADRLENLPPFWTSFALTLTETVGAGILALPIAFAAIGAAGGILLLLALGLINVLTIGAMAEAVARNGNVRYGHAYFGRLVQEYLGKPGLLVLTPTVVLFNVTLLFAYAIGFSSTLSAATGLQPVVWVALHLVVVLFFLRKETLNATVASALGVGFCSIALIIGLILVAAPHISGSNLRHSELPLIDGQPFDAPVLELIFGVVLLALFGHTATANCAALVLEREPTGKALIRGSMAAILTAGLLYSAWVLAVNGAVPPEQLSGFKGTALTPLSDVAGPGVYFAGTLFVVLSMGMASIHMGWGILKTISEWLPSQSLNSGAGDTSRLAGSPRLWNAAMRRAIRLAPVLMVFLLVALLFSFDKESFTEPLGFLGVIAIPIVSGIFSMLMLAAARRKGDSLVGYSRKFLGNPIFVAVIVGFFLAAIFVHGLVIWSEPIPRSAAIAVGCVLIVFILLSVKNREFATRTVAQVRYEEERGTRPVVELVTAGERAEGTVSFRNGHLAPGSQPPGETDSLDSWWEPGADVIDIRLDAAPARELKVWVHQLTAEGVSRPVRAILTHNDGEPIDLKPLGGKIVVTVDGNAQVLQIRTAPGE